MKMSALLVIILFSVIAARSEAVLKPIELQPELKNGIENLADKLTYVLYKKSLPDSNIIVSPVNIFGALSVLLYGADGSTREEIANFLGFPSDDKMFIEAHKNYGEFLKSLEIKKTGPCDYPENKTASECIYEDVSIANGIFLHKTYSLVPSYAEGLQSYYGGAAENVDFANEPVVATNKINKWIANKTHNLIPNMLKEPVDPAVRIIMAATLYFSAKWSEKTFYKTRSNPQKFSTETSELEVEYMHRKKQVPYYKGDSFEAISLSYRGGDFEAMFVLPNINISMTNFVESFSKLQVKKILNEAVSKWVNYEIPLIQTEWNDDLVGPLRSLNLTGIFSAANLAKLVSPGSGPLKVSKVSHSTKLKLDEKGTVATGVITSEFIPKSDPISIQFFVNRPFLLIIYHKHSSMPLFTAVIRNPTV